MDIETDVWCDKSMPICIWSDQHKEWFNADVRWVEWIVDYMPDLPISTGSVTETILALMLAGF